MTKKEALLEAAKELFGEYGYTDSTFKKISERAGVALGLLRHHFGTKEKLFFAAALDILRTFIQHLQNACAGSSSGYEGVLLFCRAYLDFTVSNSSWLVLVRCSPYSDMSPSTERDIMFQTFNEAHDLLSAQLSRGIVDGSIRKDIRVSSMTQALIGLMVGVNRTKVLTPYADEHLYEETLLFVQAAIRS